MNRYIPPSYNESAFTCPKCNVVSQQTWSDLYVDLTGSNEVEILDYYEVAVCTHCKKVSLWYGKDLEYPIINYTNLPEPNEDLDEDIRVDFIEAGTIAIASPRGATALLRLCLQKLCIQLGEKGKNINDDIGALVKKGLSSKIQKALDVIRVIGNNAVHPGQINIEDDQQTAITLMNLINLIADAMISQPKHVESLYATLPELTLEAIAKRDKKNP